MADPVCVMSEGLLWIFFKYWLFSNYRI